MSVKAKKTEQDDPCVGTKTAPRENGMTLSKKSQFSEEEARGLLVSMLHVSDGAPCLTDHEASALVENGEVDFEFYLTASRRYVGVMYWNADSGDIDDYYELVGWWTLEEFFDTHGLIAPEWLESLAMA